jgi:large subunit ribosomal protein L18e
MSRIRKLQAKKSNPNLVKLIDELLDSKAKNEAPLWKEIAKKLASPRRNYAEINVAKIQKFASNNETILVPGKVLGGGDLSKSLNVAALSFSETARKKIENSGGRCFTIKELIESNPKGTGVRILT